MGGPMRGAAVLVLVGLLGATMASGFAWAGLEAAQQNDPSEHKVNICHATGNGNGRRTLADFTGSLGGSLGGSTKVAFAAQADAPSCAECGSIMIRNGSCYKCLNCGSTSGCS